MGGRICTWWIHRTCGDGIGGADFEQDEQALGLLAESGGAFGISGLLGSKGGARQFQLVYDDGHQLPIGLGAQGGKFRNP